jgi:hypothetical protein
MAPEVVYMRFVRDELIGSTQTGKTLVGAFNAFYYSWSPVLARGIEGSEVLRAFFRVLLLPLVGIVYMTAEAFACIAGTTGNRDVASLVAFLAAGSMSVATYVGLPLIAMAKFQQVARRQL